MSNGSEHTPERCVHAVDGPDWAGLRELYPAEVDYAALIADLTTTLSDAARCHSLNIQPAWYGIERDLGKAVRAIKVLSAERDALQARLDAMTVEWGYRDRDGSWVTHIDEERARGLAAKFGPDVLAVSRLVGPWTVVPEGDAK